MRDMRLMMGELKISLRNYDKYCNSLKQCAFRYMRLRGGVLKCFTQVERNETIIL